MVGRWNDEREWRERQRQERYDDRYDVFGREDGRGREGRSFDGDRVFGERESGVGYNRPQPRNSGYGARSERTDHDWQGRDYGGVSPAMQRGDYDTGYRANPRYERGGRFYGDDGRERLYRDAYGYDNAGRRFGSYEADQRWAREMRRPDVGPAYGGSPYDYDRGYGNGERYESRDHHDFEDRARDAGEFFRRTGRKISNWFSEAAFDGNDDRARYEESYRGHRGVGPKGYQRSDERISDEAHQRLTDDHWLDASEVNLSVSGGEVTLTGSVNSREAKHRAERIVEDLSGVKHVQNNLRIDTGSYPTGAYAGDANRGYGYRAATASSEQVKDVTDGNTTPPAQKRN